MNPIALGMMLLGFALLAAGRLLMTRRRTMAGSIVALLGFSTAVTPVVLTWLLAQ